MTNLKSPFLDAIVKSIRILLSMKQKELNRFTKKELEDEISNLVKILLEQEDFQSFLLNLLAKGQTTKKPKPKTGPLGNAYPVKM